MVCLGAIGGLLTGSIVPNRNVVTVDQLEKILAPINQTMRDQNRQLKDIDEKVSNLTGQIDEQDKLNRK
jgi:hypothetical protein